MYDAHWLEPGLPASQDHRLSPRGRSGTENVRGAAPYCTVIVKLKVLLILHETVVIPARV